MSEEILVSPGELRTYASQVQTEADQARDSFTSLRSSLSNLADSFRGRAAVRFDERFNEWDAGATQLMEALQSLGEFLNTTAETMESVDEQLASGLG